MQREFGISGNTLLHTEWINKKILLYSTGTYIQCPVINHHGEEHKTRMCMFVQLNHCDVQRKYNIVNQLYFSKRKEKQLIMFK